MFTHDERRALVFLAVVTAVGAAFRVTHGADAATAGAAPVAPGLQGGDIVRQAAQSRRAEALARPLAVGERVDVDRAPADELQRLPRVGPALARRMVEERDAHGPFGTLEGLRRVTGIGPRLVRDLEAHVSFGGVAPAAVGPSAVASSGTGDAATLRPARRASDSAASRLIWVATSAPSPPAAVKTRGCAQAPRPQPRHGGGFALPARRRAGAGGAHRGRADGPRPLSGRGRFGAGEGRWSGAHGATAQQRHNPLTGGEAPVLFPSDPGRSAVSPSPTRLHYDAGTCKRPLAIVSAICSSAKD